MSTPETDPHAGAILTGIARAAIESEFRRVTPPHESADWLAVPGASFVTLTRHGRLRGCIGSLTARHPLGEDVRHNAHAAAFADSRFLPLTAPELDGLRIEVSVLSALEPLEFTSEADALQQLRPGVDGLALRWHDHRGTFLPQVWQELPDRRVFLHQLKRKAGLPEDFWDAKLRLRRYTVKCWQESERPLAHA
ncbi:MAG: AmmeMemoRadiSam system protein A [Propionicimonas sp.]|uniref:AmmeMemoRadiSam system protein A n=1 Tax=Propionicimonas sp. TaxID=1955623 RepID=UPI002B20437C|nr:AmmeMemoRadiSam system protein A [Propionicimonas sp.]MEA4943813.1 AmmeMemoRadiSam system protein A [Propionicimonas sp.]MEA5055082.1 AmmeMemoRadiSam system protein A [Propionicimonas sp.]MEA5118721.1 AmmeMemoRadiSam system protein A [Propionicimonas sp.]